MILKDISLLLIKIAMLQLKNSKIEGRIERKRKISGWNSDFLAEILNVPRQIE